MSKIKLFFSFILMLFSVFLISLTYSNYLHSFQYSFYQTSFYLQIGQNSDQMMKDIENAAANHKVEVFFLEESNSADKEIKTIYGTNNAMNLLCGELQITSGVYKQLLASDIYIEYEPLTDYSVKTMIESRCYIIGDMQSARDFKSELIDLYAGAYPAPPTNVAPIRVMLITWCLVYAVILLLTLTSVYEYYKEITVRIINGYSVGKLIAKKLVSDDLLLIFCYLFSYLLLSRFCYVNCYMKYSATLFIAFLILNSGLYFLLFRFQIKKAFSNTNTSNVISVLLVLVKVVAITLYISLFTLNAINLKQIIQYTKQKSFFKEHSNYSYVSLMLPDFQMSDQSAEEYLNLYNNLFSRLYEENAKTMLGLESIQCLGENGILMSEKAFECFSDMIVVPDRIDIPDVLSKNKGIILLPPELSSKRNDASEFYGGSFIIATYDGGSFLSIDMNETYPSTYLTDPIICIEPSTLNTFMKYNFTIPMYETNDIQLNDFLVNELSGNKDGWSFETTNIYDCYLSYRDKAVSMAIVYSVLIICLTFLLAFTNIAILRIYLSSNRQEIVVKLILGNNFLSIFRSIFTVFMLSIFLIFFGELIYVYQHIQDAVLYVVISGIVVIIIDTIVWIAMVKKMILNQLTKTLKGGAL